MKYDVVILYEHRTRELENCCLLAVELENRGYKVGIFNIYEGFRYFAKSKVVIAPHLYNEQQLIWFGKNFFLSNRNIIDMQYEQVVTNYAEGGIIHDPKGQCKYAHHIAWGNAQVKKYLRAGIDNTHIHNTGHIGMDLLRPTFRKYFYSREYLAKEFDLDPHKKWVLFISSFSLANRTKEDIDLEMKLDPYARDFAELSDRALDAILDWFELVLPKHKDKIFIYRPHPHEVNSKRIDELCNKYNNFKYIRKYSIRQWMHPVDIMLNWISTSIADIYFANKKCGLIRPFPIKKLYELTLMNDAVFIKDVDQLDSFLNSNQYDFPVSESLIADNYGDRNRTPAYKSIADLTVKMISDDNMGVDFNYGNARFRPQNETSLLLTIKLYLSMIMVAVSKHIDLTPLSKIFKSKKSQFELFKNDIYRYQNEVRIYKKRFRKILQK